METSVGPICDKNNRKSRFIFEFYCSSAWICFVYVQPINLTKLLLCLTTESFIRLLRNKPSVHQVQTADGFNHNDALAVAIMTG